MKQNSVEQQLNNLGYEPENMSDIVMELFHKYDILKSENKQLEMFLKKRIGCTSEDLDNIVVGNWYDDDEEISKYVQIIDDDYDPNEVDFLAYENKRMAEFIQWVNPDITVDDLTDIINGQLDVWKQFKK